MNTVSFRLEQIQTRARMQASQVRFLFQCAGGLYVVSLVSVLLVALSRRAPLDYAGLWLWVNLGLFHTVTWGGYRYATSQMVPWLNTTVYNGTPIEWLIWAMIFACLPVLIAACVGWWYVHRPASDTRHIRGAEMFTSAQLHARLPRPAGVTIAGVTIPAKLHREHLQICGSTGSGKSVVIRDLLRQIAQREEPCLVFDPDGEFTQEFYSPERGDYLLNPLDARFSGWNPWAECLTEADVDAQAASLFPLLPTMNGTTTAYYHRLARVAYREMLAEITSHDPQDIPQFIEDALANRPNPKREGTLSTMQIACDFLRHMRQSDTPWLAREWIEQRRGWCFFTFREQDKASVLPFVSLCLDSISRYLLTGAMHPTETTWMVIDELATLGTLESLPELFPRARKRGVGIIAGFQNVLQLNALYGKDLTASMLDQPSTRLFLRTSNYETQQWCANIIGREEVERIQESETVGPEHVRDSINRAQPRKEESVFMPSQFGVMPELSGVLKVGHYGSAPVTFPYVEKIINHPAFVGHVAPSFVRSLSARVLDLSPERRKV